MSLPGVKVSRVEQYMKRPDCLGKNNQQQGEEYHGSSWQVHFQLMEYP
jgi:hypothetical protein